jgi:hypothetical protein
MLGAYLSNSFYQTIVAIAVVSKSPEVLKSDVKKLLTYLREPSGDYVEAKKSA